MKNIIAGLMFAFLMLSGTAAFARESATRNPAEYLNRLDTMGTITAGKAADLVFLNANPLEDIRNTRNIWAVVLRGRVLWRAELDEIISAHRGTNGDAVGINQ